MTKQKISESRKGKKVKHSEETKEKIRLSSFGKKHTEESKRKNSEKHKGKAKTDETKKKLSIMMSGKKHTLETKLKISMNNAMNNWKNPQEEQVCEYYKLFGGSFRKLSRDFGIGDSTIKRILQRNGLI